MVVSYDHLGVFSGKLRGLGDNPDTGFRAVGTADYATEVAITDADGLGALDLRRAGAG
jgi:hypothetical protein